MIKVNPTHSDGPFAVERDIAQVDVRAWRIEDDPIGAGNRDDDGEARCLSLEDCRCVSMHTFLLKVFQQFLAPLIAADHARKPRLAAETMESDRRIRRTAAAGFSHILYGN